MDLKGKTVILGVSGSIAAYKTANLASALVKKGADVHVLMTANAVNFINPITFETLTSNKCITDTFDRNFEFEVGHVSLAKKADVFMIAPATANVIAKAAHGIADDMLTTTLLAATCPKIVAPAMNTAMLENKITQDNIAALKRYGFEIIEPATGRLACGDSGAGKMPEPEILLEHIISALTPKDLKGKKILVTAGPTRERIDPVRFVSNLSTGKMGYAIATAAARRGADVTLVSGPTGLDCPQKVTRIDIESADEMAENVIRVAKSSDIIIKAAAVADYRPATIAEQKIKKTGDDMSLQMERTKDILKYLGSHKREGQFICGFSMETQDLIENTRKKLVSKNVDLMVANNVKTEGAGFGTDTNVVTLISADEVTELPIMSKLDVADRLLDKIKGMISQN